MNIWSQFEKLIPSQALLAGTVTAVNSGDGTSTIELPDGAEMKVMGTSVALGAKAFVRGGEIIGEAPHLTVYENVEV